MTPLLRNAFLPNFRWGGLMAGACRKMHTATKTVPGFLLDIDGVVRRGDSVVPRAGEAMKMLTGENGRHRYPFVFVSNGGGCTEAKKANELSALLDCQISANQIILSHSPMASVTSLQNKHVLLIGQGPLTDIAASYGFTDTYLIGDVDKAFPLLDACDKSKRWSGEMSSSSLPLIEAIFVMTEPIKWEQSLQLLVDILSSNGDPNCEVSEQTVPICSTNPDLVWAAQHDRPRLGQGAFKTCLCALFEELTGKPLQYSQFGKPHKFTYDFAASLLTQQANQLGCTLGTIYGVGDNPKSDIRGANQQPGMTSVLVRSGVFQGQSNDPNDPADHVVDDLMDAISLVEASM